tara:strand:- start:206 stop:457 length:252 start_codon:yes stop_codon:yes gene_type:complete
MKTTELQKAAQKLILASKNLDRAETGLPEECKASMRRALVGLARLISEPEQSATERKTAENLRKLADSISGLVVARCKSHFEQ